jgi:hypothetical protein
MPSSIRRFESIDCAAKPALTIDGGQVIRPFCFTQNRHHDPAPLALEGLSGFTANLLRCSKQEARERCRMTAMKDI